MYKVMNVTTCDISVTTPHVVTSIALSFLDKYNDIETLRTILSNRGVC